MAQGYAVARQVQNKLRAHAPREFICLIGGTSNTFNGWCTWIGQHHHPEDLLNVGGPPPKTYNDIKYYLNFRVTGYDINPKDEDDMRRHGWSADTLNAVIEKGGDPKNIGSGPSETHDRYWANFIGSACHLYSKTGKVVAPMRPVEPRRGDIVTFLVYYPAYQQREKLDWDASPYNFRHKDKLEAKPYWDPPALTGASIPVPEASSGPVTTTKVGEKVEQERKARDKKRAEQELKNPLSEDDINFYILMRTTRENEIIKRPNQPHAYRNYMAARLSLAGWQDGLLYKLVFFSTEEQALNYISEGKIDDNEDGVYVQVNPPGRPASKDVHGHALKPRYTCFRSWDGLPNVDRKHIRECRFDYFGHSSPDGLFIDYGWNNAKGEVLTATIVLDADLLAGAFVGHVLSSDACACLWGCFLGAENDDGNTFAGRLAKLFPRGVTASETLPSFDHILENKTALPAPVRGDWKFFPHVAARRAAH